MKVLGVDFDEICEIFKRVEIINKCLLQTADDDKLISEYLNYISDLEKNKVLNPFTLMLLKNETETGSTVS